MGGGSSKAESAYKETQLSEFAAQYKNVDMPHLRLCLSEHRGGEGLVTTNTSDMPAALDAIGNMCASLQVPLELIDKSKYTATQYKTQVVGPFTQQLFMLKNSEMMHAEIYRVALCDALEPLGWKADTESVFSNFSHMSFTKVGGA
jgi:hypothetical protein